jgi:broad specificity phosphatase PhoE
MVSSAAAFAEQVPGMTEAQVLAMSFYAGFLTSADRIGFWLSHSDPPGDSMAAVAARIAHFAASLDHSRREDVVVGVTQSPVLRAVACHYAGTDPGEPPYLTGYCVQLQGDGRLAVTPVGWKLAGAS